MNVAKNIELSGSNAFFAVANDLKHCIEKTCTDIRAVKTLPKGFTHNERVSVMLRKKHLYICDESIFWFWLQQKYKREDF